MDNQTVDRLNRLHDAITEWLRPDNHDLKEAIDRTVNQKLFSFEDVKHQILVLKKTLNKRDILRWAEPILKHDDKIEEKNILCLHAGNLPLVGLQDLLATIIAGHHYRGKISRKDPYLLPSLLKILAKKGLVEQNSWTTDLTDFSNRKAEAVLFAGSTNSVNDVFNELENMGIATSNTPALVRTADFSIAYIEDSAPETMNQLAESVFRYGGKGCRSVAMVVAPFSLKSKKCGFTDYIEQFLMKAPQHDKAPPALYQRYAYNKAVGIDQAWLDNFLIEETDIRPSIPYVLHWVQGGKEKLGELIQKYSAGLQTVYVKDPTVQIDGVNPELLVDAQQPPIYWKPDGVDSVEWLLHLNEQK